MNSAFRPSSHPSTTKSVDAADLDLDLDGPAAMLRDERRFRAWCAGRKTPSSGALPLEERTRDSRSPRLARFTPDLRPNPSTPKATEPFWE